MVAENVEEDFLKERGCAKSCGKCRGIHEKLVEAELEGRERRAGVHLLSGER